MPAPTRLKHRAAAFYVTFLVGLIIAAPIAAWLTGESRGTLAILAVIWFAMFAAAQFILLNCPHCGRSAIITPSGMATPLVGNVCRHCGKEY